MAAADVDLVYLSAQAGVAEQDLDAALTVPTGELVEKIFDAIITKFREFEQDKFQLGIELEGATRSAESRCEQFKATTDKALKEVEELRQKLQTEGAIRETSLYYCLTRPNPFASQKTSVEPSKTSCRPSNPLAPLRSPRSKRSALALPRWRHQTERLLGLSIRRRRPMPPLPMSFKSSTRRS